MRNNNNIYIFQWRHYLQTYVEWYNIIIKKIKKNKYIIIIIIVVITTTKNQSINKNSRWGRNMRAIKEERRGSKQKGE